MSATDILEQSIGDALFLGAAFQPITQWTVVLFTATPVDNGMLTENGTLAAEVPTDGTGYQALRHDPGTERWERAANPDGNGNTVYRNTTPVAFPVAQTPWPAVNGFGLRDQLGRILFCARFSNAKSCAIGQQMIFAPGELQVTIG